MKNNLNTTNQNSKKALAKSKSLLNLTNSLLANRPSKELIESFENFRLSGGPGDSVSSIVISSDGKYIISGIYKSIKLWEISSGKCIRIFNGHNYWVNSVAITLDMKYIVSGDGDYKTSGLIKLWELDTGKELQTFEGHSEVVKSVAIAPNGKYIVSSTNKTIKIWKISSGECLRTFEWDSIISSVAITPDGKYIVSGGGDGSGSIALWEISSGECLGTFEGHESNVNSLAVSTDMRYIASGSDDKTIKLWNVSSGKELHWFEGHSASVSSVAITPNGEIIVSGSWDGTIKLWDISKGKLLCSYASFEDGKWLSRTPEGYYNCSDEAYKYFCFVDDSKNVPLVVSTDHPVYKAKKKEILLSDYLGGVNPYLKNPAPETEIGKYRPEIDIDEDEIPF